jgi:hypothetical protein
VIPLIATTDVVALRPGQRPWAVAAAAYIFITLPFVSPLVNYQHLLTASYEGDSRLLIWTLAWDAHALLSGTPLFDANIFYPLPQALSHTEHHIGIGVFALPVYAATANPVLTYWIVWLLAFPLNALAMHALAWRVTRDHGAAFIGGLVYAFCFFRMHHAHGHIQLLWTWALPLLPLALERWLAHPTWPRAALVTALVVVPALTSGYLAVFVGLLALMAALILAPGTRASRAHVLQAALAIACAAFVVTWSVRPYFGLTAGPVAEAAGNSADLASYLVPPENTWLGQWLLRHTSITPRWIWGEQTIYIGMTTLALAAIGAWRVRRTMEPVLLATLLSGLFALALSFGPSAAGVTPFDLFASLPGMGLLRSPARFALLVMMAVALLASASLARPAHHPRLTRGRVVTLTVLAVLILAESFVVAFPSGKPQPLPTPRVYERVATLPAGAVLSLPTYRGLPEAFREADYLLFSTEHWKPIVNGFGRQDPPEHAGRMDVLGRFPAPDAIKLMRMVGIRYAVLHTRRSRDLVDHVTKALASDSVRLIASADGDFLFQIQP